MARPRPEALNRGSRRISNDSSSTVLSSRADNWAMTAWRARADVIGIIEATATTAMAARTRTTRMILFRLTTGPFAYLRRKRRLGPQVYNSRASKRSGFTEERRLWSGIAVLYRATSGGFGLSSGGGSTIGVGAGSSSGVSGVSSSSSSRCFGSRSSRSSREPSANSNITPAACAFWTASDPSVHPMFLPDLQRDAPTLPDLEGCLLLSSDRGNRLLPHELPGASSRLDPAVQPNSTAARDLHAPLDRGAVPCNRDPSLTTVFSQSSMTIRKTSKTRAEDTRIGRFCRPL